MTCVVASEVGRGGRENAAPYGAMSLSSEEVAQRIVTARKEKRWSRLDLATAMDVSPSSIYRWEIGRLPSVHELIRLAAVLEKPVDHFTEPPERQVDLADLRDGLDALSLRLQSLEEMHAVSREAVLEILASIHDQLVLIQEQQGREDAQASRG